METDRHTLFARDAELAAAVEALVGRDGGAVAIVGEAGVGKSTLLEAVAAQAGRAGMVVRRSQGAAAEVDLPFVGLHDLFAKDVDALGHRLTPAMREAIATALLRLGATAPAGTDALALNLGVVELLELLGAEDRVLLVLDDLQWADRPTLAALRFALRRVPRSRASVVAVARPRAADLGDLVPDPVIEVTVSGLGVAGLRAVVEERSGLTLSLPVAVELHELAGGNPMLALEIVRSSDSRGVALRGLAVPQRHRVVLERRIAALPTVAREALLGAALMSRPTVSELSRICPLTGLVTAERAGFVTIEGNRIRFTHPLFASTCRDMALPGQRREMHGRLASVAADETERARHLGLSALGPDEETAAIIAKVAAGAAERAAIATAADLAVLAAELTPPDDAEGRLSRLCTAASLLTGSGNHDTAIRLLDAELEGLEPGPSRARCLVTLAKFPTVVGLDESLAWLQEARNQPGLDSSAALEIEVYIVLNHFIRADFRAMLERGAALETAAEAIGRTDLAMMSRFAVGMAQLMVGVHDTSSPMWSRLAAESPQAPLAYQHPDLLLASEALLRDDHASAQRLFGGLAQRARDVGDLGLHADLLFHLGHVDLRRGRLAAARAALEENHRVRGDGRTDESTLALLAQVLTWQGDLDRARALAREAIASAQEGSDRIWEIEGWFVLGLADVAENRHETAAGHLMRVDALTQQASCGHPNIVPWFPDAVEALLAIDRADDATYVTDRACAAARVDIPTAHAMAQRCRGLMLSHTGELASAEVALAGAVETYAAFGVPLEGARTLLALGAVRRRMRRKASARADLARARDIFRDCGAPIWVARAQDELDRAAGISSGTVLTSSERSVAELAAAGTPNREIAGRLYLSEKTVEAVLTRVYRKLSVRSRTQLARRPELERSSPGEPSG